MSSAKDVKPVGFISEWTDSERPQTVEGAIIIHPEPHLHYTVAIYDQSALDAARAEGFAECRERAKEAIEDEFLTDPATESPGKESDEGYTAALEQCLEIIAALQPADKEPPDA